MLIFANPTTGTRPFMAAGIIGLIDTPGQGNSRPRGATWCADNGCGPGKGGKVDSGYPGDEKFLAWLRRNSYAASTCVFATAPDVVGDAAATLERSRPFLPQIRALGYPVALVAQNGLRVHRDEDGQAVGVAAASGDFVGIEEFDVLFLGGSPECPHCGYVRPAEGEQRRRKDCPACGAEGRRPLLKEWKLRAAAVDLARAAKAASKWVHMGRVNSATRYRIASDMGCDSCDGTYLTFGPDINLPKLLGWRRGDALFDPPHLLPLKGTPA